jgi:hypothetical protein
MEMDVIRRNELHQLLTTRSIPSLNKKENGDVLSDIPVQSIIFLCDYGVTRRKKLVVFVSGEFV